MPAWRSIGESNGDASRSLRECQGMSQMLNRFMGEAGRENLVEALLRQRCIGGERALAGRLAIKGEVIEFQRGDAVVEQHAGDDDVFFILSGTVEVFVNLQKVADRGVGDIVGEMVLVDPTARRSATVKAASETVVLRTVAAELEQAAQGSPSFWRYLAQVAGERLRERAKFHLPANETPIMFLGSSVEGLEAAKQIESRLEHFPVVVRAWYTRGVFGPSETALDDLIKQVDSADFAVFVFGPDDVVNSREQESTAPRDNVIFEMGLFVGRLGRERVFMVKDRNADLKIPSDLAGINPITYSEKPGGTIADAVGSACTELESAIEKKGVVSHRMRV